MVQLQDSHKWSVWDEHQNNGVEEIFDGKYPTFKFGEMLHEVKAKCANGDARFKTFLKAEEKKQFTSTNGFKGATLAGAWEWKGKLYDHLVKLKVGAKGVDCHVDAGRRNFFNNNVETNLFWGQNIPAGGHPRDAWQWSWRGGMIYQMQCHGWNMVGVSDCRIAPNKTNTGPGALGWTDRYCLSKDEHEVHSTLNVETGQDGKFVPNFDATYQYKGGDWMSYLKGAWEMEPDTQAKKPWNLSDNSIPSISWGASYLAHKKYANLAYRVNYNHNTQTAQHSAGFEGKCYDDKVYYKAHVHFEGAPHESKEVDAPAPKNKAVLNFYNEHKCNANFSYKYKVAVDLMNPSDWKWGAVFASSS